MLVLSRGPKEKIVFPNLGVSVEILRVSGNRVRVGVDAPKDVRILRHELADSFNAELQADTQQAHGTKLSHQIRNRLNTAHVALGLMEKQLNAGMHEKALVTLHRAIREFDAMDAQFDNGRSRPTVDPTKPTQRRALLVEDDCNESELLAGFLELSGFDVDTAEDGIQAMVQLARFDRPDVVLLDMHMPRMNGPETVRAIRSNPAYRDVKLFAVTGSSSEEMGVAVGPDGVDHWIQKPFRPQALVDELNRDFALVC